MRGTVTGGLWGLVIGGFTLAVGSQLADPPVRDEPSQADAASEQASVSPQSATEETSTDVPIADAGDAATQVDDQDAAEVAALPEVQAIAPEPAEPVAEPVVTPDTQTVKNTTQSNDVAANDGVEVPELDADRTAVATAQTAPEDPITGPDVASDPEQGIAPELSTEPAIAFQPDEPVAPEVTESPAPVAPAEDEAVVAQQVPAPAPVMNAPTQEIAEAEVPEDAQLPVIGQAPTIDTDPAALEQSPALAVPNNDQESAPQVNQEPLVVAEPAQTSPIAQDDTPSANDIRRQAPVIVETEPQNEPEQVADRAVAQSDPVAGAGDRVRVNRPGAEPGVPVVDDPVFDGGDPPADDAPPMQLFATPFENTDAAPLLTIVLVDPGETDGWAEKVAALGFPVTVVLDPLSDGAKDRMQTYRANGIEVGLQTQLPEGATPSDVEVAFEAAFGTLPEAVLLFSDGEDGIQSNRDVTAQVMQVLASEGRGLIAVQQGLGNTLRVAGQLNVPAVEVARDLDGQGQDERAVNRALDQAAFRARQIGDAVLLGRMSTDTLDALSTWAARNRSDQITLAPATAILLAQ